MRTWSRAGAEHRVQHGGHRLRLEMPHLVVKAVQDLGRVGGLQGVGAQRAAHPAHDHRCFQPGAGHVANHGAHLTRRENEHVVPVAADVAAAGNVTRRHLQPADRGEGGGQQAVLQRRGGGPVHLGVQGLNRQCGTIRRQLQQVRVIAGEGAGTECPHVQDTDDHSPGPQRSTHEGPDALVQQDGVDHLGVIDLSQDHRAVFRRDPPGETPAERDPHPLPHLFFQPARGRRDQLPGGGIQQQHGGRIGLQGVFHPADERLQQSLGIQRGQRRISDRLDVTQLVRPAWQPPREAARDPWRSHHQGAPRQRP